MINNNMLYIDRTEAQNVAEFHHLVWAFLIKKYFAQFHKQFIKSENSTVGKCTENSHAFHFDSLPKSGLHFFFS